MSKSVKEESKFEKDREISRLIDLYYVLLIIVIFNVSKMTGNWWFFLSDIEAPFSFHQDVSNATMVSSSLKQLQSKGMQFDTLNNSIHTIKNLLSLTLILFVSHQKVWNDVEKIIDLNIN